MKSSQNPSRRSFLGTSVGALAGAGFLAGSVPPVAEAAERARRNARTARPQPRGSRRLQLPVLDWPLFLQRPTGREIRRVEVRRGNPRGGRRGCPTVLHPDPGSRRRRTETASPTGRGVGRSVGSARRCCLGKVVEVRRYHATGRGPRLEGHWLLVWLSHAAGQDQHARRLGRHIQDNARPACANWRRWPSPSASPLASKTTWISASRSCAI